MPRDFSVEDFVAVTIEEGDEAFVFATEEEEAVGLAKLTDGRVSCLKCGKQLASQRSATRHYAIAHQFNLPAKCLICKQEFKNKLYRDDHYRKKHNVSASAMKNTIKPPETASWNKNDEDF